MEREVSSSALFTFWLGSIPVLLACPRVTSFLAQLAYPPMMFLFTSEIINLSLYQHCLKVDLMVIKSDILHYIMMPLEHILAKFFMSFLQQK